MAYNLGTIREAVRNRLDDEDFEQEYLDRAINFAQRQITNKQHLSFMEATTTLTVNPNDVETSFPADYHKKLFLRIISPSDLRADLTGRYYPYADFVANYINPSVNPVSRPYNWSEYGQKIKWATPSDQTYTLRLDYLRKSPYLVNDTDVPDIPEEFEELLELGAYMRIAKREDDYDVKNSEMADYAAMLVDLLHVYGRGQTPRGIRRMRVS